MVLPHHGNGIPAATFTYHLWAETVWTLEISQKSWLPCWNKIIRWTKCPQTNMDVENTPFADHFPTPGFPMAFPHRFDSLTALPAGGRGISGTFTVNWFEQEAVPTMFADISWRTAKSVGVNSMLPLSTPWGKYPRQSARGCCMGVDMFCLSVSRACTCATYCTIVCSL